jgi:hypothetical protein
MQHVGALITRNLVVAPAMSTMRVAFILQVEPARKIVYGANRTAALPPMRPGTAHNGKEGISPCCGNSFSS